MNVRIPSLAHNSVLEWQNQDCGLAGDQVRGFLQECRVLTAEIAIATYQTSSNETTTKGTDASHEGSDEYATHG